jgi:hypothetical protein
MKRFPTPDLEGHSWFQHDHRMEDYRLPKTSPASPSGRAVWVVSLDSLHAENMGLNPA